MDGIVGCEDGDRKIGHADGLMLLLIEASSGISDSVLVLTAGQFRRKCLKEGQAMT